MSGGGGVRFAAPHWRGIVAGLALVGLKPATEMKSSRSDRAKRENDSGASDLSPEVKKLTFTDIIQPLTSPLANCAP